MEFKLSFTPAKPNTRIHYQNPLLLMGSCFSDHIAALLQQHAFGVVAQPNGVVFNAVSLAHQLQRIITQKLYTHEELFLRNELWHSWQHHTSFSGVDKERVLTVMNDKLLQAHHQINQPKSMVVITLGTAMVYQLNDNKNTLVANCHKYPGADFTKRFLQVDEIVDAFTEVMGLLENTTVYFTISPVRHVRDGLVENNISKGILHQAVHALCGKHDNVYYFPAYEMVIDELRDYRFYNEDMIHPSEQAVQYVWQKFVETCMDTKTQQFVRDVQQYNVMKNHVINQPETLAGKQFLAQKQLRKDVLIKQYGITID
jgi:hypothetical protein